LPQQLAVQKMIVNHIPPKVVSRNGGD